MPSNTNASKKKAQLLSQLGEVHETLKGLQKNFLRIKKQAKTLYTKAAVGQDDKKAQSLRKRLGL